MKTVDLEKGVSLLHCPMGDNDADASTVKVYFGKLLKTILHEGEGFSGKRPFGNSGWEHEIATAWSMAGLIPADIETHVWGDQPGEFDVDVDFKWNDFYEAVDLAIAALLMDR